MLTSLTVQRELYVGATGLRNNTLFEDTEKVVLETRFLSFFWVNSPQCARATSFTRFLDHIRHSTVGSTPLDE